MKNDPASPILLAMHVPRDFVQALGQRGRVLQLPTAAEGGVMALPATERAAVRVMVTMGTEGASAATIAGLPALGLISCLGSGYEAVDLGAARARRIVVTHSPSANASAVADVALGLLIASVRRFFSAHAYLQSGAWKGNATRLHTPVRGLTGRRVGIYGMGAIGLRIAQRVEACEMEVAYHNRHPRNDVRWPYHATLLELAHWSDVLVVAVRAGAGNRHAVNAQVLKALGPTGHVVNISRGAVIDETALVTALSDGTIEGAGLDVFEHEPDVPAALLALSNVALTPHIGGTALDAQKAMQDMLLSNLDAFLAGLPVPNPVAESEASYAPAVAAR